jgi:phosphoribosylformimino-5-aminoimidazole carboxamide ribotide isomerase
MRIVPVVDLQNGVVVRAVKGERDRYRPLESALCGTSDPVRVARILLEHCGSRKLYVADLDALAARAAQAPVIEAMLAALPTVELWLDAGFASPEDVGQYSHALGAHAARVTPVFGSESLRLGADVERCFADRSRAILSLDRRNERPLDPAGCWEAPGRWPNRVIMMTLDRVGAFAGPDLELLAELRRRAPHSRFIGAGGIRDADDLAAARRAGAYAWLVASALHDLRLPRQPREDAGAGCQTGKPVMQ